MKRLALAMLPLALAGCGGTDGGDGSNAAAPAAPVAAAPAPAGTEWAEQVVVTPEGGYRMGNPNAPIKLVEYGSRTCPHCQLFATTGMDSLRGKYVASGKVSYEFRDFLVHAPDVGAALLGQCAGVQTFFPMLEQMYATQQQFLDRWTALPNARQQQIQAMQPAQAAAAWADSLGYVDFMKQHGLPEPQARGCLADQKKIDAVVEVTNDAMSNKAVTGTPAFFLNGKKLDAGEWDQVEAALKTAGA